MTEAAPVSARHNRINPWLVAGLLLLIGVAVAPWLCFYWDMRTCWLPWAQSSGGSRPWDIYLLNKNCNYPPFVPYLLTIGEWFRLKFHASRDGPVAIFLVKIFPILADAGGVLVCYFGLRKWLGERAASVAGLLYALALPIFFNAAIWGQYDALLSFAVVLAMVLALNGRSVWFGAAAGWALSIKLQAIMALPGAVVYLWRTRGWREVVFASIAGVFVLLVAIAPYARHAVADRVQDAYGGAVDFYPRRTMTAFNTWYLLDGFDTKIRKMPQDQARADTRVVIGPITHKRLGLMLVAADIFLVLALLYRNPKPTVAVFAAAMGVFAFFMLATQMHGRYIVPAVGLLAMIAPVSRRARWLFIGLAVTATLNQGITFLRDNIREHHPLSPGVDTATLSIAMVVAAVNVGLFVLAHWMYWREAREVFEKS